MKKIIHSPQTVCEDMLEGLALSNPNINYLQKYRLISRKNINRQKVNLISGGGSGHEPAHAGFVGEGMLDLAVCGDVFASPSQIQVYQGIKEVASEKGVLLIIKNYSGDIMNFKNAMYLAQEDGIAVDYVKVDDDIAVQDSLYTVGHRGVAGTVFVHKIAGAAAQKGASLQEVKQVAQKVIQNVRTLGFAFTSCTTPANGKPTFHLEDDEMEFGVGIHGEPGIATEKIQDAQKLAQRLVDALLDQFEDKTGDFALLINGFGATPLSELYVFNKYVAKELFSNDIGIARTFVGNYMTSLDMSGASVSLLKLDNQLLELLDSKVDTNGFSIFSNPVKIDPKNIFRQEKPKVAGSYEVQTIKPQINEHLDLEAVKYIVDIMASFVIKNELNFNELDQAAGDGDFGTSVAQGFKSIKDEWDELKNEKSISDFLNGCALVLMENCGGASGPIWGSAFRGLSKGAQNLTKLSQQQIAAMLQKAVSNIQETGERSFGRGASVGDKTLIDALVPATNAWQNSDNLPLKQCFENAAIAAKEGCESTKNIVARMGRAGTAGERSLGFVDAGAFGVAEIFANLATIF